MLMPSIFGENLFDDFDRWMDTSFRDVDKALYGKNAKNMMKRQTVDMKSMWIFRDSKKMKSSLS